MTVRKEKFRLPKDEMNLSNCLKRHLDRDLNERGIIADREVEIRQKIGEDSAQHIDVLVRAIPFDENGRPASVVSVIIEVKGAWNRGTLLDMRRQLYDRYMNNSEMNFSIYVVGYFGCNAWDWKDDDRRASGQSQTPIDVLKKKLKDEATSLTNSEKLVQSIVLDARLNLPQ